MIKLEELRITANFQHSESQRRTVHRHAALVCIARQTQLCNVAAPRRAGVYAQQRSSVMLQPRAALVYIHSNAAL